MQRGTSLQYSATPGPFSIVPSGSPGSWPVPCYSPSLPSEIDSASGSTRHDYWVGVGRKKGRGERRDEGEGKEERKGSEEEGDKRGEEGERERGMGLKKGGKARRRDEKRKGMEEKNLILNSNCPSLSHLSHL